MGLIGQLANVSLDDQVTELVNILESDYYTKSEVDNAIPANLSDLSQDSSNMTITADEKEKIEVVNFFTYTL